MGHLFLLFGGVLDAEGDFEVPGGASAFLSAYDSLEAAQRASATLDPTTFGWGHGTRWAWFHVAIFEERTLTIVARTESQPGGVVVWEALVP